MDVRIITDGDMVKYMHFKPDGDATDETWFSADYLQDSSWTDVRLLL